MSWAIVCDKEGCTAVLRLTSRNDSSTVEESNWLQVKGQFGYRRHLCPDHITDR